MKRKIFFRFFTVTLISVLIMFIFGIVAVDMNTRNVVEERLKEETELVAALIDGESDFSRLEKYRGNRDFRITAIDTDGNVLYESETVAELENHKNREEVINALSGKPAAVERYSDTFKCDMTYYAVKASLSDGSEIVIRLAVKSSQLASYIRASVPLLAAVLAASLAISFILSSILSRSVSSKVTEIGDSLKSLNSGKYTPIKTDMSEPELFSVLNQINELNAGIHSHIRAADGERAKLNAVLDNVAQSIIALDSAGKTVFANKSALSMLGGTHHDIGRDLVFLIEDLSVYKSIKSHLGENYAFECTYGDRQLSIVISTVGASTVPDGICAILIITDITKEKLIEKQKSDFFANASHELKTPVTVLQGLSELLLAKDGIDDASKKQIDRIHRESMRLGSLISDMLMLSRIEGGDAAEGTPEQICLESVADEVISELSEEIKKRSLTACVEGCATVTADRGMIYELVENLVSNAVKYNKDGGSLTVSLTETDAGARLCVQDTGIGIEKEHLPRLCERFYRVDRSHSKRIGGTGLGLAIVKHICAILGAELTVESEFGIGTSVTVVFGKK